jgi:hypothetical protein
MFVNQHAQTPSPVAAEGEPKSNRLLTPVNDGCIGDCHHGMISRLQPAHRFMRLATATTNYGRAT